MKRGILWIMMIIQYIFVSDKLNSCVRNASFSWSSLVRLRESELSFWCCSVDLSIQSFVSITSTTFKVWLTVCMDRDHLFLRFRCVTRNTPSAINAARNWAICSCDVQTQTQPAIASAYPRNMQHVTTVNNNNSLWVPIPFNDQQDREFGVFRVNMGGFRNHACEYLFNDQQDGESLVVFVWKWEVFVITPVSTYSMINKMGESWWFSCKSGRFS